MAICDGEDEELRDEVKKKERKEILKSYKIACLSGDIRQCSLTLIKTTDSR